MSFMINFVSSEADSLFGKGELMGSLCKSKQLFQLKYTNTINISGSIKVYWTSIKVHYKNSSTKFLTKSANSFILMGFSLVGSQ